MQLLPRRAWENAVQRYPGQRRERELSCMDHLLAMLFAQLTRRDSLRDLVRSLAALGSRRYHCGFRGVPIARSTLADANERRDWRIFQDTALALIRQVRGELPADPDLTQLQAEIYALDSTTIDLCLKLFPWAQFRRRKAAVKAHTLLDLKRGIPVFVRVSHGKTHDLDMLDRLQFEPGACYMMDKAYTDFARLYRLHCCGGFFVTRLKRNADYRIVAPGPGPCTQGVRSDKLIRLRGPKSRRLYPERLRKVRYRDPETGKTLTFLTNHLLLDAPTVALLYKKRWKIELLFKWLKGHLHIQAFYGTSSNAVQIQIWIAVIAYVLILRLKHRYGLQRPAGELAQILSITLLEKTPIPLLFSELFVSPVPNEDANQLLLFDL